MNKAIISILVIIGVLAVLYFIYTKFVKISTEGSVVNTGTEQEQTKAQYLIQAGVPASVVDGMVEAAQNIQQEPNS